jgi:hypothetical protein
VCSLVQRLKSGSATVARNWATRRSQPWDSKWKSQVEERRAFSRFNIPRMALSGAGPSYVLLPLETTRLLPVSPLCKRGGRRVCHQPIPVPLAVL